MRVIAGTYRSRILTAPRGTETRPTSDKLRETLFNVLAPRIPRCRFCDLYAGTGAVGIEALSRGAAHVWFTENAPSAIASLRANLAALRITTGFTLEDRGTGALLQRLGKLGQPIDILYLDPPYEAETEYEATLGFLGSARGRASLAPDALVVAEHSSKIPLAARYGTLHQTRTKKQGDAALTFYAYPADEVEQDQTP
jgi:16S rRNA (guanine(966)-N(2))-methyltransferase RsmD